MGKSLKEGNNSSLNSLEFFASYLRNTKNPLKQDKLSFIILAGNDRTRLQTPYTGAESILLQYKNREASILSVNYPNDDVAVLQLQGAKQEGVRVYNSFEVVKFFADLLLKLTKFPESTFERITLPYLKNIEGISNSRNENVLHVYIHFIQMLTMSYSEIENKYIRDLK